MFIHHVSVKQPITDIQASMVKTVCEKLSSPSLEKEGSVAQQDNQQHTVPTSLSFLA